MKLRGAARSRNRQRKDNPFLVSSGRGDLPAGSIVLDVAKVARREGQRFESAIWLHKARSMETGAFRREVARHLTGKETEPWELLYFRIYKSQLPVIEQAIETAGLMLGTNKSRGYCLEMICADFLAGAGLESKSPETLLLSMCRLYELLPAELKQTFSSHLRKSA